MCLTDSKKKLSELIAFYKEISLQVKFSLRNLNNPSGSAAIHPLPTRFPVIPVPKRETFLLLVTTRARLGVLASSRNNTSAFHSKYLLKIFGGKSRLPVRFTTPFIRYYCWAERSERVLRFRFYNAFGIDGLCIASGKRRKRPTLVL